ncbi:filamentous hemagglutinin family outer membrane protein [Nostoc sp. NIES-2111]|nr:filamentous hemagglutinin family outer membrane protein [Nostoc sp. NIES-2111]
MQKPSILLGLLNGVGILRNCLLLSLGMILISCDYAKADVIPDGTLNTTVTQNGSNFTITDGTRVGNNLFHSFSQFSVSSNGSAVFNNTTDIQNIFSRVTGGNISSIDGLIQANGSANLFLLNPAGILFRANAKLDIGGSFVGSTANSIKFVDGAEFGVTPTSGVPLLTLAVPIGLQFGTNPKPIQVEGTGHNLKLLNPANPGNSPINPQSHVTGIQLEVKPGKTLALIGGDISLVGGTLKATDGRIELGSVGAGIVSFEGGKFNYDNVQSFRDIRFSQKALADASGFGGGAIQMQGARVSLIDGSVALIQNLGSQSSGGINIRASELFEAIGVDANSLIPSDLRNETLATGNNEEIAVTTRQLVLEQGGRISSYTYGSGKSSNITLKVDDSLQLIGFTSIYPNPSTISTGTYSVGSAGDINISTRQLTAVNGGAISAVSLGRGAAGNVAVKATEFIELDGFMPGLFIPSSISSPTLSAGNAGNVQVDTARLILSNGGRVDSSTVASGNGGNLVINATESIEVRDTVPGSRNPSLISSSANIVDDSFRQQFGLPSSPTGDSGSLTINTGKLTVSDGALINVQNEGSGDAGSLRINAGSIFLNNRGRITASAKSGEGGNLNLQVQNTVLMRRGSLISTEAGGTGNGGNLTINAPFIIGLENSDIIANAFQGNGGKIQLTTKGIFGLEYRPQLTPENDITASSQFGVSGEVQINNIGLDPNSGLVELPANVTDPSQQISTGCANSQASSFVGTGRGGVPQNPNQQVGSDRTWSDTRDISAFRKTGNLTTQTPISSEIPMQATYWHRNAQGKIELVAASSSKNVQTLTCTGVPKS